jgi:hypothetical protein
LVGYLFLKNLFFSNLSLKSMTKYDILWQSSFLIHFKSFFARFDFESMAESMAIAIL